MKAIILAGGFATRLWPLTEKKAKPLLLIQNQAIISHLVKLIPSSIDIIISTNRVFEDDFILWKKQQFPQHNIEIFVEDSNTDKAKIGALGAIALIIKEKKITEEILVLAGDNYFGFNFNDFIDNYQKNPLLAVYDIKDKIQAQQFGVVVSNNGRTVDEFQEKPTEPKSTLVSTGAYIFPPAVLPDIINYAKEKNDDLGGIFEYLKKQNKTINIFTFNEAWFDIGSFQGYLSAHKYLQPEKILLAPDLKQNKNEYHGAVSIAENCQINHSILDNVIIFPGTKISHCEIRNCIIDHNCNIRNLTISYKVIRANSVLF